jgi:16S rRNA (cytosine967-C5)-methyltransferase
MSVNPSFFNSSLLSSYSTFSSTLLSFFRQTLSNKKIWASSNQKAVHYGKELIRYRNKINFVFKKTLRSSFKGDNQNIHPIFEEFFKYLIYRLFWEHSSTKTLESELDRYLRILKKSQNKAIKSLDVSTLKRFIRQLPSFSWDIALRNKKPEEKLSIQYSIPSFLIRKLTPYMDIASIQENLNLMDFRSRNGLFSIRVNLSSGVSKKNVLNYLHSQKIPIFEDPHFTEVINLRMIDKFKIIQSDHFKKGEIIIQNRSSVIAGHLLDAKPGELIIDLCSAPGNKTNLIANLSENKSRIIAAEYDWARISRMPSFFYHIYNQNIHVLNSDGIHPPFRILNENCSEHEKFDKILLDVPCSGSGTFFDHPELKWRQNYEFLERNVKLQQEILHQALKLVKVGGIIVYSNCSMYAEEGEVQMSKLHDILKDQIEFMDLPSWISPGYSPFGKIEQKLGRTYPSKDKFTNQAFFYAKLQRMR